jgi:transcriptional regulator CtsR
VLKDNNSQSQGMAMARLSDEIEHYLRQLLERSPHGYVDIQRSALAQRFDCVPSQITYVLMTRFSVDRGYLVEARRGGGGGIRVLQLQTHWQDLYQAAALSEAIDQDRALQLLKRAEEAGLLTAREASLAAVALRREVLGIELPERDALRGRLLRAMLTTILRPEGAL